MLSVPGKFCLLFSAPQAIVGSQEWREKFTEFPLNERIVVIAVDVRLSGTLGLLI